jgi:hypothetical protein
MFDSDGLQQFEPGQVAGRRQQVDEVEVADLRLAG